MAVRRRGLKRRGSSSRPRACGSGSSDPAPRAVDLRSEDVRWILYTSGTTSSAKGALHGDASIAAGARWVCTSLAIDPADRFAIPFALTHISGIAMLMVCLMSGASAILVEQFDDATPARLGQLGCTIATGGTPLVLRYLEAQRRDPARLLFPKLKAAMAGAAPKPHSSMPRSAQLGGLGVVSCYGLDRGPVLSVSTAATTMTASPDREAADPAAKRCIVDARRTPRPAPGQSLRARPAGLPRYLDSARRRCVRADGYFRTGDLPPSTPAATSRSPAASRTSSFATGENIAAKRSRTCLRPSRDRRRGGRRASDAADRERSCAVVVLRAGATRSQGRRLLPRGRSRGAEDSGAAGDRGGAAEECEWKDLEA
jgi:hypothetical protein